MGSTGRKVENGTLDAGSCRCSCRERVLKLRPPTKRCVDLLDEP
jgi:hypothetical protein